MLTRSTYESLPLRSLRPAALLREHGVPELRPPRGVSSGYRRGRLARPGPGGRRPLAIAAAEGRGDRLPAVPELCRTGGVQLDGARRGTGVAVPVVPSDAGHPRYHAAR